MRTFCSLARPQVGDVLRRATPLSNAPEALDKGKGIAGCNPSIGKCTCQPSQEWTANIAIEMAAPSTCKDQLTPQAQVASISQSAVLHPNPERRKSRALGFGAPIFRNAKQTRRAPGPRRAAFPGGAIEKCLQPRLHAALKEPQTLAHPGSATGRPRVFLFKTAKQKTRRPPPKKK